MSDEGTTWLSGGCHCGAVRFRVRVGPGARQVVDCNCSMCRRKGYLHHFVGPDALRLGDGVVADPRRDELPLPGLAEYRFGTGVARHWFCRTCGIHPVYVPRSHPDGFSVNLRCLDDPSVLDTFEVRPFDGEHWEASIASLRR